MQKKKKEVDPKRSAVAMARNFNVAFKGVEPGDNSKFLSLNLELMALEPIDLRDYDALKERISQYFAIYLKYDMKPTVTGLAMALKKNRTWLSHLVKGLPLGSKEVVAKLPTLNTTLLKETYELLANLYENYMLSGKINPVSGIFMGKNHYGYKDTTDYTYTLNNSENNYSVDDIKQRYLELEHKIDDDK